MNKQPIDIDQKFSLFTEQWSPKVIARINDYLVKIGKLQGDFVWHKHDETDELFLVNKGVLRVDLRERPGVRVERTGVHRRKGSRAPDAR
jgi:hypothetical protein